MTLDREARLRAWELAGFFVEPRLLDSTCVAGLAETCDHVLAQVRLTSTVTGHTSTHVTNVLAPEYFTDRPQLLTRLVTFASSRVVVRLIEGLGAAVDDELTFCAAQYFHEPSTRDYDGAWHRDGDEVQLPMELATRLPVPRATSLRVRVPLAFDDHLELVPGSHRRDHSAQELKLCRGSVRNAPLTGDAIRLSLAPGDVCVFNTWAIHRGRYRRDAPRRTLDLLFRFGTPARTFRGALIAQFLAHRGLRGMR